jgi:hypothetical protein
MDFVLLSMQTALISLNSIKQTVFVIVKCGVFFAVRAEYLNIIKEAAS